MTFFYFGIHFFLDWKFSNLEINVKLLFTCLYIIAVTVCLAQVGAEKRHCYGVLWAGKLHSVGRSECLNRCPVPRAPSSLVQGSVTCPKSSPFILSSQSTRPCFSLAKFFVCLAKSYKVCTELNGI